MFNVIRTWSNWDAVHEAVVGTFPTQADAEQDAQTWRDKSMFSAFLVRPVEAGVTPCEMFAPSGR